jgi:hypothetical protein
VGVVGVIVNPWAGKDIRRLHAPVGHTPDTAKVGIVRRVIIAALDAGADRVLVAGDVGRISERAVKGIAGALIVDGPGTGSALDTRRAAAQLGDLGCCPLVLLGGDGTCRDVAIGAPEATIVAISTGTNNVYPMFVDGSSAGTAAGLIAAGAIDATAVARSSKLLTIDVVSPAGDPIREIALVDVALIDARRTGARAVVQPSSIRLVVAAIATPTSTGLSSIAGRVHPLGRHDDGAVCIRLNDGGRQVRVPIVPGAFDVVAVDSVELIPDKGSVTFDGPGVLAYDGERDRMLAPGSTVTVSVSTDGPAIVDVDRTLHCAARRGLFDVRSSTSTLEAPHGD